MANRIISISIVPNPVCQQESRFLPKQILLTNLLPNLPFLASAADRVDEEQLLRPMKWDIHLIRRFMLVFGIHSYSKNMPATPMLQINLRALAITVRLLSRHWPLS
ncbi:MAG: hypothetical protein LPK09_01080 [Hymenobacteraceae bacterium]|nr:hypothetical protein [Hymenobacteraceae bacterium]